MNYDEIEKVDKEIYSLIKKEESRQKEGLELIPSENYASSAVLSAQGSIFNDKYAENYPGKRYYGGCVHVDELETLCQERALKAFGATDYHVNVQPYSGSPANIAVYIGLLEFGDTIMALSLDHGGHLTHGSPVSFSGKAFNFVHYEVNPEKEILDYDSIMKLAQKTKPKIIISGYTAYPRIVDFQKMHEIAKSVGAISMADISHISGLVIGNQHPSPFPFTDIVTTTTHKTLRGPRGAMIFCKKEYKKQIDKAVFPGLQGGPHEHVIAGISVALGEATKPDFKLYAEQIVKNAKVLAETLKEEGLKLVSGGTDNHLILIDLRIFGPGKGIFIEKALEEVNISVNKSPIPNDPSPPFYPSGIRLGTPAVTSRGMKEKEMKEIGHLTAKIVKEFSRFDLPSEKEKRPEAVQEFKNQLKNNPIIKEVKDRVKFLAVKFSVPGLDQ